MARRFLLPFLLSTSILVSSRAKTEAWLEVHAPHFIVLTNSTDKQARRVADQFERMRAVFHKRFPDARIDAASPIIVIAVKDKKDFQALEPLAYLAKGQLDLAGLFVQAPDKNYVLLRLDVEGPHPYATVYHEYTHFVVRRASQWMPLWLNEGLAQFYENSEIKEKEVGMGEASPESIMVLRQNRLLPLATLFAVNYTSPYYHEENKGSIFYAESWALTHYLMIKDQQDKTQHLTDYAKLVSNKVDPVIAGTQAFGDLGALEKSLSQYVSQGRFYYFKIPGATDVDDFAFQEQTVSVTEADAIRADFLAYDQREADSRALLDQILKDDPNNVSARETMGFLAFRDGKYDEAGKWYGEAVKLDSQSFLAHYYFATIAMREPGFAEHSAEIEASLRTATKLNPSFAPAFDQLAAFYGMQHKNLDDAAMLNLVAAQLDPGNINIRMNRANLMMELERPKDAIAVLQTAMQLSPRPEEMAALQSRLDSIQRYLAAHDAQQQSNRTGGQPAATMGETSMQEDESATPPESDPPDNGKHGPRRTVNGTLRNVQCSYPAKMTLRVEGNHNPLGLRAQNYYKVAYSALNFKPSADLNPCKDLEGMTARIEYFEGADSRAEGLIISIRLSK
jgi:tetratricopeptide (TPR) repeat protein